MTQQNIAAALKRVETILQRRPETGLQDDAPATARWEGNTRVVASHSNGTALLTDMPAELGGSGDQVTPGWLFRARLASCAATSIVLVAASEGITLSALAVRATSKSDTRGMLGMEDSDGEAIHAGPGDVQLDINVSAPGVAPERLHAIVQRGIRHSPVPSALQSATPLGLNISIAN